MTRHRDVNAFIMTTLLVLLVFGTACDPSQQVDIVADDFRFSPAEVRVSAERPIRVRIINGGREPH